MVWGFTQGKSGGVGLWNHCLWNPESGRLWPPVEMVDVAMARLGMVRRLRSCRVGQRREGERGIDCLLHWRLVPHMWEGELGRSWARAVQEQPISQHAPSLSVAHTVTQNVRHAKVSCTCKTTGILGETGCERGMPPGTSSLPPWQCRKARKAQVCVCVWSSAQMSLWGRERSEQGKWANCMSQRTSGEWETGKPLGAVRGLLVFRVQGLGNSSPAKDIPWCVLKVLTWIPSFLWGLATGFGGLRGKTVRLHLREFGQSRWSKISDFVIGDLHQVTLRGKLWSRWPYWTLLGPTGGWLPWHVGCVGKQRCLIVGSPSWA